MTEYLLDTNVVSELRKPRPHGAVTAWLGSLRAEQLFISAVTLGELQAGVQRTREQDPENGVELERWADEVSGSYQVLPMDAACFREWARLMHRKSGDLIADAMIAATARVHGLIVATRTERDFHDFEVELFNPFRSASHPQT
jgi:toxin FitB